MKERVSYCIKQTTFEFWKQYTKHCKPVYNSLYSQLSNSKHNS